MVGNEKRGGKGNFGCNDENNKAKIKQTNKRKTREAAPIPIHRREKSDSPNH